MDRQEKEDGGLAEYAMVLALVVLIATVLLIALGDEIRGL